MNLYLKPPDGQVLVTAPRQVPLKRIREFVEGKADWIRKHQERMQRAVASREAEPELSRAQRDLLREKVGVLCREVGAADGRTCHRLDASEDEDPLGQLHGEYGQDTDQHEAVFLSG